MSDRKSFKSVKLGNDNYGRLTGGSGILGKMKISGGGVEDSPKLSAATTILSIGLLVYELYYVISNKQSLTGVILTSIFILIFSIFLGFYIVNEAKAGFFRFLGGFLLQAALPALLIYRSLPFALDIFKNWWILYGIFISIMIISIVIAYTERFSTFLLTLLSLIGAGEVIYVVTNYLLKGFWNGFGVVIWGLLILVCVIFAMIIFHMDNYDISRTILRLLVVAIIPAVGLVNVFYYPDSFWSGWWYVFLISAVVYGVIAAMIAD